MLCNFFFTFPACKVNWQFMHFWETGGINWEKCFNKDSFSKGGGRRLAHTKKAWSWLDDHFLTGYTFLAIYCINNLFFLWKGYTCTTFLLHNSWRWGSRTSPGENVSIFSLYMLHKLPLNIAKPADRTAFWNTTSLEGYIKRGIRVLHTSHIYVLWANSICSW